MSKVECPYCHRQNYTKIQLDERTHAIDMICKYCDKGFSMSLKGLLNPKGTGKRGRKPKAP